MEFGICAGKTLLMRICVESSGIATAALSAACCLLSVVCSLTTTTAGALVAQVPHSRTHHVTATAPASQAAQDPPPKPAATMKNDAAKVTVLRHGAPVHCIDDDDALLFTPERKVAFLKPVVRATQNKRLRAGPALPFLDDFSEEDARKSFELHDAEWSNAKKSKRKHSASF